MTDRMPPFPCRLAPAPILSAAVVALALGGCMRSGLTNPLAMTASTAERDCMARAMYFESNRSSQDGMLAVGTVVVNRLQAPKYPKTICGVVGEHRQFAHGVLSKPVEGRSFTMAQNVADAIIAGKRHDDVGAALHFHTAGYTFPYRNMAYVAKAGGNVFYEKKEPGTFTPVRPHTLVARDEPARTKTAEVAEPEAEDTTSSASTSRHPTRRHAKSRDHASKDPKSKDTPPTRLAEDSGRRHPERPRREKTVASMAATEE